MSADDVEKYAEHAEKIGIDATDFITKMKEEKYLTLANEDFSKGRSQGVRGFPAMIFTKGDESYLLSSGFSNFETLDEKIQLLAR